MSPRKDKAKQSSLRIIEDNKPVRHKKKAFAHNDDNSIIILNKEELEFLDDIFDKQGSLIKKHEKLWKKSFDPNFKPEPKELADLKADIAVLRASINEKINDGTLDANIEEAVLMIKRLDDWEARLDNLSLTKTVIPEEPKTENSIEIATKPSLELTVLSSTTTMPATTPELPKELFPATQSEASDEQEQEKQENIDSSSSNDTPHN